MTQDVQRPQRPATRAARLSVIEEILLSHIVTSQSQLSQMLAKQGIEVTQATLSRDLDEVNATKTRLKDGTVAYVIGDEPDGAGDALPGQKTEQQMSRVLSGLVTSVAVAHTFVVVQTPAGAAQYVASVIDKQPIEGILGTIAGDDTVLVICTENDVASMRAGWLLDLASKGQQGVD